MPIAVYVAVKLRPRAELVRGLALAAAGAAPPIALLLAYHAICFGSPWRTGYDASVAFAAFHQRGFLGITRLRGEAFWGSLVRPDNGLLALSPWWLLAIPGGALLWRRGERAAAAIAAAVAAIYLLFISSINFWRGGWEIGPRYITAMLPFLLPPIAAQLQAWRGRPVRFGLAAGLAGAGVGVYVLSSATFPYWPDSVGHPLYDITFRLLGENLSAPNLGGWLGAGGLVGLLPYLAVAFGAFGAAIWRTAGARGLAIAAAVAVAILAGYRLVPHGDPRADAAYRSVRAAVVDL